MANYYYKSTGTTWNAASSWDSPTPGTTATVIPTFADDVFFTGTSAPTCNVNTAGATLVGSCRNITTTGYTGTITLNVDLRVYNNHVISATTAFAGSGWYVACSSPSGFAPRSMTSNGVLFPNFQVSLAGSTATTLTFLDPLNVTNIQHAAANPITTNGSQVNVNGNMTMVGSTIQWLGSTIYNLIGTGNFGSTVNTTSFGIPIVINSPGNTITFLANVRFATGSLTYTAGTVNTTANASSLILVNANTITSKNGANEIIFNNVIVGEAGTTAGPTTLNSDMRVSGNFTVLNTGNGYNFNNNTIYVAGNIINPSVIPNGGTSVMEMYGSTPATISAGTLTRSLTINKGGGAAVTLLGNLTYGVTGRTLTINTPLDLTTNTTTVTITGSPVTITNSYGSQFYNLTVTANTTLNIN
jgi:hypothetical protein